MAELSLDLQPVVPLLTVWGGDAEALGAALGMKLPGRVSRATLAPDAAALRLGPEEWLIIGRVRPEPGRAGVEAVDVTGAWVSLRASGPAARALLAKGAALDLAPRHFPAGYCARTRLARCPVILLARAEAEIDLLVARSYAPWLLDWLRDAGREFGLA